MGRPRERLLVAALLLIASSAGACKPKEETPPALASSAPAGAVSIAPGAASPSAAGSAEEEAAADAAMADKPGTSLVDLDGSSRPLPAIPDGAPRIAARALLVPIHLKPSGEARKLGWLRAGAIVEADAADAGHDGCPGGWRAIKPAGYVCLGDKATTDLSDPIVRATARRPDHTEKLPYMYGIVTRGGPAYARIPTDADLKKLEPGLDKHLAKWKADRVSGADYGQELWFKWKKDKPTMGAWDAWEQKVSDPEIPFYLQGGGSVPELTPLAKTTEAKIDQIDRRQGHAFIESFLVDGRRWNVTTDLRVVPADRYRPIKGSDYHGVKIGTDVKLPFVLIRRPGAKRFVWQSSKKKMVEDGDLDFRSAWNLTGKQKFDGGVLHFETTDGFWVDDRHASRVDPAKRMPKWGKNGEKWIDVNITKQVLVAYEGENAVYSTLVSTGEDGLEDGKKSTKKGIFRIHTKYVTTTMDSDVVGEEFELRDVPYVQYFEEGFALHGAYWHDVFGKPKSHGCINLAPEDARRLFFWTEPQVPPGWHGAARPLTGTVVFIHP